MVTRIKRIFNPQNEHDFKRGLYLLFGIALTWRLYNVATNHGSATDIFGFQGVSDALHKDYFGFYDQVNQGRVFAYPYPPLYTPVLYVLDEMAQHLHLWFGRLIRLPEVAADVGIAFLVQWHMGWRGHSLRARTIAAALILFNPATIALSSMHGQLDPVQWLFGLAGLIAFERLPAGRRAWVAGLLIGIGAGIKTVPILIALALLPHARDLRERAVLVGCAVAVPLLALVPFLIADWHGTLHFTTYQGFPGQGGLSMILQPDLALLRFSGGHATQSGLQQALQDVAPKLVVLACLAVTVRSFQKKPDPAATAAALILCVFVFGANYFQPYVTYLIPFIVMVGWRRLYWVVSALMFLPLLFLYFPFAFSQKLGIADRAYDEWAMWVFYIPPAAVLWFVYAGKLWSWFRRPEPEPEARAAEAAPAAAAAG